MAAAGRGRLGGGEIVVVTLSGVLVLVLAIMLAMRLADGGTQQTPTATATSATGAEPEPSASATTRQTEGEDLSGVTFDFVAPSGNIGCAVSPERALCAIASYDYADAIPAAEVAACDGTVGQFLQVTAEGAGLVCDTSGQSPTISTDGVTVLEYGTETSIDGYTCRSETSGMTCRHDASGYSFSLRRAGYTLS